MKDEKKIEFSLSTEDLKKIFTLLLIINTLFAAIYLIIFMVAPDIRWGPLDRYFDLDEDMSLPAWYSSLLYVLIALPALSLLWKHRGTVVNFRLIYLAAVTSLFLGMDEAIGIHEQFTVAAKVLNIPALKEISIADGRGTWMFFYAAAAMIVFCLTFPDIKMLWISYRHEMIIMLVGGFLLLSGEIFLEIVNYIMFSGIDPGSWYILEVAFEEFFAMMGISTIWYGAMIFLIEWDAKNAMPIQRSNIE